MKSPVRIEREIRGANSCQKSGSWRTNPLPGHFGCGDMFCSSALSGTTSMTSWMGGLPVPMCRRALLGLGATALVAKLLHLGLARRKYWARIAERRDELAERRRALEESLLEGGVLLSPRRLERDLHLYVSSTGRPSLSWALKTFW